MCLRINASFNFFVDIDRDISPAINAPFNFYM